MRFTARSRFAFVAAILAATLSVGTRADTLHTTNFVATPADIYTVHRDSHAQTVYVGGFIGVFDLVDIVFWCYDLDHTFSFNQNYDYTETPMADATREGQLARLFDEAYAHAISDGPDASAAFQLAIWNIGYDTDVSVSPPGSTTNHFWATAPNPAGSTARDLANTWLQHLNDFTGDGWTVSQLVSTPDQAGNHHQNFITATYRPPQRDLPEPSALALVLLAMAGCVLTLRFRGECARGG
ncbi:MAG TPA: hypothetical protein VGI14_03315 [Casimicrobiaceae bacterium]|jgi:hypothetical protein